MPGYLGTKGGLLTDEHARVLRKDGEVILGLDAAGNTSASIVWEEHILGQGVHLVL
jgi:3-oxosteroid 1-dehydrogenase